MKRVLLASLSLLAIAAAATPAASADLPRQMPVKAPAYVPAYYNWTGLYVGINGGGAFGNSNWSALGTSFNTSGGLIGGTVGYNWQMGQAVFGLEGDADWSSLSGSTTAGCPPGCKTESNWLSTIRGRLGYAADRWMPYVTAGAAFGNIDADIPGFAGVDTTLHAGRDPHGDRPDRDLDIAIGGRIRELGPKLGAVSDQAKPR